MNSPALVKYTLYGVLGWEVSQLTQSWGWLIAVLVTVYTIEQLGIIQSRRF